MSGRPPDEQFGGVMRRRMRKRIIPGAMVAIMVTGTVFMGATAKAKGDAVFHLSAGSAKDTESEADNLEYVEMRLKGGVSAIVDASFLKSEEELQQYKDRYEAEIKAEREARFTLAMAKTTDYVNVRSEAGTEAERVGVLYKDCGGTIIERGDSWTKIRSGDVLGWVSNDFLYLDEEAEAYAEQVCKTYANVDTQALRIRKAPGEDTEILGLLEVGTDLETVKEENPTDGWIKVMYEGKEGFVSTDYVTTSLYINEGETLEEIAERERLAALEKAKLVTRNQPVAANVDDLTLLAAIIHCEAGNQPYEGKLAVGAVVCNRVRSGSYPNNIHDVIYAKGQFGPAYSGSLAKALERGVSESCRQAAQEALNGATNVGGACHFHRAGSREGVVIGDHVFY